mmetsp:Transcript_40497/g.105003  ORF Transcript_40497/g.105003 Transcript_40497/m.105003 type:complete len:241 (-) Transcript_40497:896-1618(-)
MVSSSFTELEISQAHLSGEIVGIPCLSGFPAEGSLYDTTVALSRVVGPCVRFPFSFATESGWWKGRQTYLSSMIGTTVPPVFQARRERGQGGRDTHRKRLDRTKYFPVAPLLVECRQMDTIDGNRVDPGGIFLSAGQQRVVEQCPRVPPRYFVRAHDHQTRVLEVFHCTGELLFCVSRSSFVPNCGLQQGGAEGEGSSRRRKLLPGDTVHLLTQPFHKTTRCPSFSFLPQGVVYLDHKRV